MDVRNVEFMCFFAFSGRMAIAQVLKGLPAPQNIRNFYYRRREKEPVVANEKLWGLKMVPVQ